MTRPQLVAKKREIFGRKVKRLRKEGILPANLYGKKTESMALQVDVKDFCKVYSQVGETGIVDLKIENEKETRPVLIQNVQKDPVEDSFLHVDLRQVVLTEKISATIPIILVGEAPAEIQKEGILVQEISEIEVEALPTDLPENFQIDVSKLEKVNDAIFVRDIQYDKKKIQLKANEDLIIAKIEPLAKEEVSPTPTEEVSVEMPLGEAKSEGQVSKDEETSQPSN